MSLKAINLTSLYNWAGLFIIIGLFIVGYQVAYGNIPGHHRVTTAPRHTTPDEPLQLHDISLPKPVVVTPSAHDYVFPPVTNGLAPLLIKVATREKVVFLGIDDGDYKRDFEFTIMRHNGIRASLFLANSSIKDNPNFFVKFTRTGSLIEDHTLNHKLLSHLSYDDQKQEICGEADLQQQQFGRRPILFRPPGGDYNQNTQLAAAACGMKAVVLWVAKANGGAMQYQEGNSLQAGDIVLMHFRPEFASDMRAFLAAEKAAGLHTELLEDWLPSPP